MNQLTDMYLYIHYRNQLCTATAIVYMHRFYMIHSFKAFHRVVSSSVHFIIMHCMYCQVVPYVLHVGEGHRSLIIHVICMCVYVSHTPQLNCPLFSSCYMYMYIHMHAHAHVCYTGTCACNVWA